MTSMSLADYHKLYGTKKRAKAKRQSKVKGEKTISEGEAKLASDLKALRISFEQEYKFHPKRHWKADFHMTGTKILVEIEGGIWTGGRHTRGKGFIHDMEKYNAATVLGYQVLRFSTEQVKSGLAVRQIERLLGDLK
ncbi:DUF559 domain-containing protein [Acinetobacter radioresistens]|uniref:DUF559 domain-containing protein n=1 Tax=Acinetobacter radioresistens SK82 TaxID=596318 RepID=A0ABP2GLP0_ACIRA|nr:MULTISPECIES: DUF559 domain-containing protein [Acinetobacter]EET82158.1 hypothetical protein ACIRA0001_0013 [Acinetobacter radioresistens SK82]EEY87447.1 hypothetical protein HMPREF0018_00194 [Acinetobacter radioresistens SH164]EXB79191.1 hypothetical protein J538_3164 [Acinetobacter sp. 272263]EXE55418.1 hypothetical protein J579_3091 [Acinetobacter sp. 1239920]MCK4096580.1 DUF559 domain-containing protein [Acinetobacter radioresistens]